MKKYLEKSISVEEYIDMLDSLLAEGKTTGEDQSESMVNYGKLNRQRIKRLNKTVKINEFLAEKARGFDRKMIWLTISEGWCGDAAQNMPVVEKIAAESPNIEVRYILRDENLELMDEYLTNGGRSIPKVLFVDANTFEVLGDWGPRPQKTIEYRAELVEQGLEKTDISEKIQRWYLADKEQTIQKEFEELMAKLVSR